MVAAALADGSAAAAAACSSCSPAGCPRAAATAWSPAPAGCSSRSSGSGSASGAGAAGRGRSTRRPSTGSPATASPATSTATRRASCTSPARRSSPSPARSPTPCCWRRWRCRSSTTTARWPSAAARMVTAAAGRPLIEMGSRRTHEAAAVAVGPRRLPGRFRRHVEPGGGPPHGIPTAGTAAHAYILLHDDELAAFRGQVRRSGRRRRCWSTPTTSARGIELAVAGRRAGAGRDPDRLRRPRRAGPAGPRPARRAGRDRHPDRALRRPRRVRDRRAARRARRLLRRGHLGGHRLRRADRGHGLQAGRGGRAAGGQAQRVQGVAGRAEVGGAPVQADRHRDRGGRAPPADRRSSSARTTGCCRCRWCAAASRSPACRRWSSPASTCAPRWYRCRGRASSSPAANPPSRPSSRGPDACAR